MKFPRISALSVASLLLVASGAHAEKNPSSPATSNNKVFSSKSFVKNIQGGAVGSALLGKGEEASTSLEVSIPLSQAAALEKVRDGPLMDDIGMLSDILSNLIQQEDPKVKEIYEEFQKMGITRYVYSCFCYGCECVLSTTE
jgi:hypothetical protein